MAMGRLLRFERRGSPDEGEQEQATPPSRPAPPERELSALDRRKAEIQKAFVGLNVDKWLRMEERMSDLIYALEEIDDKRFAALTDEIHSASDGALISQVNHSIETNPEKDPAANYSPQMSWESDPLRFNVILMEMKTRLGEKQMEAGKQYFREGRSEKSPEAG